MKVCIIGGTGLLGAQAAQELIDRGHDVVGVALPPLPEGASLPKEMGILYGNYIEMSDQEIANLLSDCQGLIFAAGIDERVEGPAPIYDLFAKYNITALERLLRIGKQVGVLHAVVCGSYFAYFEKTLPELNLSDVHPYIRSRRDQEQMALSFADSQFDVAVIELPYIFGTQPGRKPVWSVFVKSIRDMKPWTFWTKGGTTMVTVKQVGQALAGALERNHGGHAYPLGYYNMEWKELIGHFHDAIGTPGKKIVSIPKWLYALTGKQLKKAQNKAGHEGGLDMEKFAELQCRCLFIDKSQVATQLGVTEDDIVGAIHDSVNLSLESLGKQMVEMRAE